MNLFQWIKNIGVIVIAYCYKGCHLGTCFYGSNVAITGGKWPQSAAKRLFPVRVHAIVRELE
jgi:hypothetical protein